MEKIAVHCSWANAQLSEDPLRSLYFPPELRTQILTTSGSEYLNALAYVAGLPQYTDRVFALYHPVFVDLVNRWHDRTSGGPAEDIARLSSLARTLPFAPYFRSTVRELLKTADLRQTLSLPNDDSVFLTDDELSSLLLALFRLLSFDRDYFEDILHPVIFSSLLHHQSSRVRYLAIECLCLIMHFADAFCESLLRKYLGQQPVLGKWEDTEIDYRLLKLWEEQRWNDVEDLLDQCKESSDHDQDYDTRNGAFAFSDLHARTVTVGEVLFTTASDFPPTPTRFVLTPNTGIRLTRLATALVEQRPVLLNGPASCGKTSLILEAARILNRAGSMITLHLNEQTDAKSLIGMHTSSATDHTFIWQPGVITRAMQQGRWVLIEDIDKAPAEVLGILRPLIEKGELFIPSRKQRIRATDGFQVLATVTSALESSKLPARLGWLANSHLWTSIQIPSYTSSEVALLAERLHPKIRALLETVLNVHQKAAELYSNDPHFKSAQSRAPSLRELLKWCTRINNRIEGQDISQTSHAVPESFKIDIFKDAVDCYASHLSDAALYEKMAASLARNLNISPQQMQHLLGGSIETAKLSVSSVKVGRTILPKVAPRESKPAKSAFADTSTAQRCLESLCAGVSFAEPILLVGETGVGKTMLIQHLASLVGQRLTVINMSQQSEATDLLGGLKPITTRSVVLPLIEQFNALFDDTFSANKNQKFQEALAKALSKQNWVRLLKLWQEAVKMADLALNRSKQDDLGDGPSRASKRRRLIAPRGEHLRGRWTQFTEHVNKIRSQVERGDQNHTFAFVEGRLIQAVRNGEWVFLDELNLASPDTLDHIVSLLRDSNVKKPSILLAESGNVDKIEAHSDFRIFAAMNPATDTGKKDLPPGIRSRFTELYVPSGDQDLDDLVKIIQSYLGRLLDSDKRAAPALGKAYLEIQKLNGEHKLTDGAGDLPHFSLRSLVRCLLYTARHSVNHGLRRAMYEGFAMSFFTVLSRDSEALILPSITKHLLADVKNIKSFLAQQPRIDARDGEVIAFQHHIIAKGPLSPDFQSHYIRTISIERNLINLARAASMLRFPVLLQGPTSAGKTSMIEYLAKLSGNRFVRINNHEHTDLQEYLGSYSSDGDGKLQFRDGVLVDALRHGHWLVLDELNLAPSDVLEALNRLLDDNRELLIPETQEVIRPHPNFLLFATQNPAGLYGGRKRLSRAFRNRFLEIHFDDIPEGELEIILRERAQIAPSFCTRIVAVYKKLSLLRQSSRLFEQRNSFVTLRDLFRWASRPVDDRQQLANHGFMLLGERVRDPYERQTVKTTIEETMKVRIDEDKLYDHSALPSDIRDAGSIVWTKAMRRLFVLVSSALQSKEPVLLIGETGCGKTQVCQVIAAAFGRPLNIYNAHTNTETGDLIGSQRPIRSRAELAEEVMNSFRLLNSDDVNVDDLDLEQIVSKISQLDVSLHDQNAVRRAKSSIAAYQSLFEWNDGSLVRSMKSGELFLLDEISLADDSVLERLNSVLEPARTILLAEKGSLDNVVVAHPDFHFLSTMNPGGDYGKRELSAALRNRLTEIWVPPLSEEGDVLPILEAKLKTKLRFLAPLMLKFSHWFKETIHKATSSTVPLRDLLAWVGLVNSAAELSAENAFLHGAGLVYIDSIGANPAGMTAASSDVWLSRRESLEMLQTLVSASVKTFYNFVPVLNVTEETVKVGDFWLQKVPDGHFVQPELVFEAPTTLQNTMRLVRALQMNRPILLEGSPGVGKTAIVTALAQLLGKTLTRINLSDQTDLMDLFGADAPAEDEAVGRFLWKDGPLLRAMRTGGWVLLDEMNLASQSVLEGLNSCLDHRKEAYVAELDKTFSCHPDFVLFAAQNPHHQGGGRKGLPASFVNRFTVVYADPFTEADLLYICRAKYPATNDAQIDTVVKAVANIDSLVSHHPAFGQGGPWELNLRDVTRWLELCNEYPEIDALHHSQTIVQQRFRNAYQRSQLDETSQSMSQTTALESYYPRLTPWSLQIGLSWLPRDLDHQAISPLSAVPVHQLPQAKSIITAIAQSWPVIIAGPSGSGKTRLIRTLASASGANLVEISMNGEIDTMDLLGGFEQYDEQREIEGIRDQATRLCSTLILQGLSHGETMDVAPLMELRRVCRSPTSDAQSLISALRSLPDSFDVSALVPRLQEILDQSKEMHSRFVWNEGILVDAVREGNWLVLDNANLCSPSVLDRLNSLLEPDGQLIISEQHNAESGVRTMRPHPKFRIFLTLDPRHGELSRAMRNRSLEVFLDAENVLQSSRRGLRYPWAASISRLRDIFGKFGEGDVVVPFVDNLTFADIEVWKTQPTPGPQSSCRGLIAANPLLKSRGGPFEGIWPRIHQLFGNFLGKEVSFNVVTTQRPQLSLLNEPLFLFRGDHSDPRLKTLYWTWRLAVLLSDLWFRISASTGTLLSSKSGSMTSFQRSFMNSHKKPHSAPPFYQFAESFFKSLADSLERALTTSPGLLEMKFQLAAASYLKDMLDFSSEAAVDPTMIQPLLQVGFDLVRQGQRMQSQLPHHVDTALSLFQVSSLNTGLGLQRMWQSWKPQTPSTVAQLETKLDLERIVEHFDGLADNLPGPRSEIVTVRTNLYDAARYVWMQDDSLDVLKSMSQILRTLDGRRKRSAPVKVSFQDIFDRVLRRVTTMEQPLSHSSLHQLSIFSSSQCFRASRLTGSSVQDALQKLVLAHNELESQDRSSSAVLVGKIAMLPDHTLGMLNRIQEELDGLSKLVSGAVKVLAADSIPAVRECAKVLLFEIISSHKDLFTPQAAGLVGKTSVDVTLLGQLTASEAVRPTSQSDAYFATVYQEHLLPGIRLLESNLPIAVGRAIIHVCLAALEMMVPDRPFDPAFYEYLVSERYKKRRLEIERMINAQKTFNQQLMGSESSLVLRLIEDHLQELGDEPPVSRVVRPVTSQLSKVQDEFSNVLRAIVNAPPKTLLEEHPNHDEALSESERVVDSVNRLVARLAVLNPAYDDIVVPVSQLLQTLGLGVQLVAFSMPEDNAAVRGTISVTVHIPLLGARPSDTVNWKVSEVVTNAEHSFHWLKHHVLHRSLSSSMASSRSEYLRIFDQFYQQWKTRLTRDQIEAQAKSRYYAYRGGEEDDEEFKRELLEIFPSFEEDAEQPNVPDPDFDGRAIAIRLAGLHYLISRRQAGSTTLRQLIQAALIEVSTATERGNPEGDLFKQLPGILLQMEIAAQSLSGDNPSTAINIYADSNIGEAQKLYDLVEAIQARFLEIADRWPEHAVPQEVIVFADEVLGFKISTPLAKLLTKVEKLLEIVAQWQSVASREWSAAELMNDLTTLIVSWRRLELGSWSRLLDLEKQKNDESAQAWYFIAYEAVIYNSRRVVETVGDVLLYSLELAKTIEEFLKSTTLGQYVPRLRLLETLQTSLDEAVSVDDRLSPISASVASIITHYRRYVPHIEKTLQAGRSDLEKAVVEQIKLASWKDTNISALRESARRSHQKLFRIVRKYRSLLGQPISTLKSDDELSLDYTPPTRSIVATGMNTPEMQTAVDTCDLEIPDWQSRPERLRDTISSASSLTRVYQSHVSELDPSAELTVFREDLALSIKTLRKETPSTASEENAPLVRHLRERKRRLLNDTVKFVANMGPRRNLATTELGSQASISVILSSSPDLTQIDGTELTVSADSAFHELLDYMPNVRGALADHSPDLTAGEVKRYIGLLEGMLLVTRTQRESLAKALTTHKFLQDAVLLVQHLTKHPRLATFATNDSQSPTIKERMMWLPPILDVARQVLAFQMRNGEFDIQELIDALQDISSRLVSDKEDLTSQPSLPNGLIREAEVQAQRNAATTLRDLRDTLEQWQHREPNIQHLTSQLLSWTDISEHPMQMSNGFTSVSASEVDTLTRTAADTVFVALQQLANVNTFKDDTIDEPAWLVRHDKVFAASWTALHVAKVGESIQDFLVQLQHVQAQDLLLSVSVITVVSPILTQFDRICQDMIENQLRVHLETSRLAIFLSKTFATLASEGFCSPADPTSGQDQEGKMESGTGLGDGEGAEDISKDVGDDEDLSEFAKGEQEEKDGSIEGADDAVDLGMDELEGGNGKHDEAGEDKEDDKEDQEDEDMDEETGSVDDLDATAVDEKMWDDVKQEAEKEDSAEDLKGEQGKGEKSDDQTGAEEGQKGEDNDGEGDDENADENGKEDRSDDDEIGEANAEGEHTDPHLQEEKALDLPEDMQLTGENEDQIDGQSDDGMEDLSDMGQPDETVSAEDLDKENESSSQVGSDEMNSDAETDRDGQGQDDEILEDQIDEDEPDDNPHTEREGEAQTSENGDAGGVSGAADQLQDEIDPSQKAEGQNQLDNPQDEAVQHGGQVAENKEDGSNGKGKIERGQGRESKQDRQQKEALKKLADVLDQWHQRREILDATDDPEQENSADDIDMAEADFEHVDGDDEGDAQALGTAGADQAQNLDQSRAIQDEDVSIDEDTTMPDVQHPDTQETLAERLNRLQAQNAGEKREGGFFVPDDQQQKRRDLARDDKDSQTLNPEDLLDDKDPDSRSPQSPSPAPNINTTVTSSAAQIWQQISRATHAQSLILTEQLRLILHPTTATKLRGDFRTGKRLNLKRIIPYIASGYKRDKIWMRRSVPSKRNYQILLAVDDSKSMGERGADLLALQTMALLCKSLAMLEVGHVGVLAFGDDVKVAHALDDVWKGEQSGVDLLQHFAFEQKGTDVRGLMDAGLRSLRDARINLAGIGAGGAAAEEIWQLFLIVSDGHCDDHENVRRLVRQGKKDRVLCVFVIVDSVGVAPPHTTTTTPITDPHHPTGPTGESILTLKQAHFIPDPDKEGEMRVVTRRYLDSFPFEYYLVVRDVRDLPGVLARCLRSWFGSVQGS